MLFTSQIFLFYFLPVFLFIYYLLRPRGKMLVLTIFSYAFYGWWDWRFCLLLLISTAMDYWFGLIIYRSPSAVVKKRLVVLSVVMNLAFLGFFKYFLFVNQSAAVVFSWMGLSYPHALLAMNIVLPVGISFYTFQSMSYTIDIYRGLANPTRNFLDFAGFISMFPQLVAGPIVRYTHMEQQLGRPVFSSARLYAGLQFFILGLAKKVIIADSASALAIPFFDAANPAAWSTWDAWLGTLAYTVQIYFDFSAYSDMAIGLGYFIGYEFPINFNSPYKSKSITEFWRRWHITLSTWLRDYLYIPLGGSRGSPAMTYRNLALTMLLGGLWHGASWHFVAWGGYHGAVLAIERAFGKESLLKKLPGGIQWLLAFILVLIGWVLFRAPDLPTAGVVLARLFSCHFASAELLKVEHAQIGLAAVGLGMLIMLAFKNTWEIGRDAKWWKTVLLMGLFVLSLSFLFGAVSHPFLYYQF